MKSDLANRYIYAVVRHLPPKMQNDVKKELDSLITDMAHERYGETVPSEQDILSILNELGKPEELALKYRGDERISLVSGANFLLHRRILKLVLPIVGIAALIISVVSSIISARTYAGLLAEASTAMAVLYTILMAIGATIGSIGLAYAVVTSIFAMIERKNSKKTGAADLSDLPEVPNKFFDIKRADPILGIVFSILVVVVFLGFPYILGGAWIGDGTYIPMFDTDIIRSLWLPIILWMVFRIAVEVAYLVEKRYKPRLTVIAVTLNIATAICAFIVLWGDRLINSEFLYYMEEFADSAIANLISFIPMGLLLVFMALLLIETITVIYKGVKSKQPETKKA